MDINFLRSFVQHKPFLLALENKDQWPGSGDGPIFLVAAAKRWRACVLYQHPSDGEQTMLSACPQYQQLDDGKSLHRRHFDTPVLPKIDRSFAVGDREADRGSEWLQHTEHCMARSARIRRSLNGQKIYFSQGNRVDLLLSQPTQFAGPACDNYTLMAVSTGFS